MTYSNQLPPMPEPHIGLPWRHNAPDGSIHSSAFTADQMHAYALQAQQLLATHVQGELPEPELGYIKTDKSNQPAFSARQMREAMLVCGAQNAQSDPQVPLSLTAAPQQAEVTNGIRPEDFTVDVVVKPMVGFAPVNTQGVRVTHNPTGISVTCDVARSQHTNRHQAFEKLRAILALHPAQVAAPMSEIDIEDDDSLRFVQRVLESDAPKEDRQSARDMVVGLRKRVRKAHHDITTQAKKETP